MKDYDNDKIWKVLAKTKNIAVVGISNKPDRDSYRVARYLKENNFNIIPVNPTLKEWEGIPAFPSLSDIPDNVKIDVVDVFRKPETVVPVVNETAKRGVKTIWFQEGIINEQAADIAKKLGMTVIMDRCMMKEHYKHKR